MNYWKNNGVFKYCCGQFGLGVEKLRTTVLGHSSDHMRYFKQFCNRESTIYTLFGQFQTHKC